MGFEDEESVFFKLRMPFACCIHISKCRHLSCFSCVYATTINPCTATTYKISPATGDKSFCSDIRSYLCSSVCGLLIAISRLVGIVEMGDLDEIRRVYDIVDENRDGRVTVDEIGSFINKLGIQITQDHVESMVTSLSTAQDCGLHFEEFVQFYHAVLETDRGEDDEMNGESKDLREAFGVFDKDGDGYISPSDLQQVLTTLGLIPQGENPQHCEKMICTFDLDSNGLLDFMEFKHMMSSKSSS